MTALAPTLQAFFTDRLARQRHASGQTVAAYRDAWRLLLAFAAERTGKQPGQLDIADLDAPLIGDFLDHLERDRGNSPRTRNARLAAIRSMFGYAALRHPEHAETHRPRAGHPRQEVRPGAGHLAHRAGSRCPARRAGQGHLGRTPGPRHARARRPDRAADLRADRPDLRRRPPRRRAARLLPRQRTKAADHPADDGDRHRPASLARRTTTASQATPCSRTAPAGGSAATPSRNDSPSTSPPPKRDAPR